MSGLHTNHGEDAPVSEFERQSGIMVQVFTSIMQAHTLLRTMPGSREASLALTKIDEAIMWAERIPTPPHDVPVPTEAPTLMTREDVPTSDVPNG